MAIESTGRARRFAFVGVTALLGATLLTRYVGASAILAVVASVALLDRSKLSQRMRRATVVGLAAVSPLGVFLAWQASAGAGPRPFAFHREPGKFRAILRGLGHSLFPIRWSDSAVTAAVAVVAVLLVLALVMHRKRPAPNDPDAGGWTLMWLVVASLLAYLVVAVISQTLFDRALRFDARFFTGMRALWTTAVVVAVFQIGCALARPWLVAATLLVAAGFLVHADWPIQRNWLRPIPRSRPSAIERRLGRLPRGALIVSDAPDIVYLTSRRPSLALPDREVYLTGARNPTFDREVDDFSQILRRRGGYAFFARGLNPTLSAPELGRHRQNSIRRR